MMSIAKDVAMPQTALVNEVNTNPLAFEELATSLASLAAYSRDAGGDMAAPIRDFEQRLTHALKQPASYAEITELTGQSASAGDRRAGRGAWLLMNIECLSVQAVHSLLWHKKSGRYSVPLLDQMARALAKLPQLLDDDLQALGRKASLIDVVGIKDNAIWLVQTLPERGVSDSGVRKLSPSGGRLFRGTVFDDVVFDGPRLATLYDAYDMMRKAFPDLSVVAMALVLHPESPDFELYGIEVKGARPDRIKLIERMGKRNSIDYGDELANHHDALWTMSRRFDNELFVGLPPCQGGRTLAMLASAATRQKSSIELLAWKERGFSEMLKSDFGYEVPRDKVRHDLVDGLVGQGFMRKWGSEYSLTVKGIARYEYCLAKYTTKGAENPHDVLDACVAQRDKIVKRYGCL